MNAINKAEITPCLFQTGRFFVVFVLWRMLPTWLELAGNIEGNSSSVLSLTIALNHLEYTTQLCSSQPNPFQLVSLYPTYIYFISFRLISTYFTFYHLILPHLNQCSPLTSDQPASSHPTSANISSSHTMSYKLISSHLISPQTLYCRWQWHHGARLG